MPLDAGSRIGRFEILAAIGVGGMGEVYRARDTRLQREVAIKVLPDEVAGDPERLARFEREARTLAALNHPNIAQIHGLEERALVMELVPGEDLSARIARGPLPVDEALAIARQVAEAFDAAHAAGIVHRDLKPANVKVRPDGAVKVLDFGLAKALGPGTEGSSATAAAGTPGTPVAGVVGADRVVPISGMADSPTLTSPAAMTRMGIILGTAPYMSPEQARGRAVDKRADIWAFGCVLYEMLTGRAAFEGDTLTDVLASIVKTEPDWSRLPPDTPPGVRRLLGRCLHKDPARRLRDIGDAIVDLDPATAIATLPGPPPPSAAVVPSGRPRVLAWAASLAVAAAIAAVVGYFGRSIPEARLQKFHVAIQADGGPIHAPILSPDGRRVAYVGRSRIWVQALDEWKARELAGTEAATRPFWSPDGEWIGYFRSEALLKVPAAGGPVVRVGTLPAVQAPLGSTSGAWAPDGTITVSMAAGPLLQFPSGGGEAKERASFPPEVALDLRDIELLPGGAILSAVHRDTGVDALGVVEGETLRIVLEASNVARPVFAPPGHLIFERATPNAGLWAVPFSVDRLEVTGEPFLIGEGTEVSVARDGTLAFRGEPDSQARQLSWFTLDGELGALLAEPRNWTEGVTISPDGRTVLAATSEGIWAYDVETGARSRVTTNPTDLSPVWVGADRVAFVRSEARAPVVVAKRLGAGGEEQVLARGARFPQASADGTRLVFNAQMGRSGRWQVAWIDLDAPSEIHRLGGSHVGARFPSVSPDGAMVAYVSGEVGRDEIFLTRLPDGEGKWQISNDGGGWTLWSPAGDAVLYRAPDGAFMSVAVDARAEVRIGQPRKLFDWGAGWLPFYAIARDGERGIAAVTVGNRPPVRSLSIVQNWHREFDRR